MTNRVPRWVARPRGAETCCRPLGAAWALSSLFLLNSGLNGVPGSIWDFVSGSFSPSPSPILNSGPSASSSASPNSAELARVRRQLDEAKRKIRQWEESWQQVKQVSVEEEGLGRKGKKRLVYTGRAGELWTDRQGCLLHNVLGFRPVMPGRERLRRPRREPVWQTVTGSWPCRGKKRWRPK